MRCGALPSTVSGAVEEQELEVQRAYLSGKGDAVVSVSSKKQLLGGNWQTFQFCPNAQLWMRVADMRNLLSG
jgi:UDP-N-acetylglucosamine:LPS N-acetylglucosamine transferase